MNEQAAAIELDVLTSESGRALMAEVAAVGTIAPVDLERWRKFADFDRVAASVRLVEGRGRAKSKFALADRMWFEPVALEQATGEVVARHKAARFAGRDVVDLCCGIGGDAIALAEVAKRVVAVDRDPWMLRRCVWNADVAGVSDRLIAARSDAERFAIPSHAVVHVDPDRRVRRRDRAKAIEGYVPGPAFLRALPSRCPGGAIKLGPASDFDEVFGGRGHEVEVMSLRGECKEATVWFGSLATCARRATMLPSGATWTDRGGPTSRAPIGPLGAFLHEPDAALIRSGLLDGFAIAHGLVRPFVGVDLFTGPRADDTPWLASFEILSEMAIDWKVIRREVRRRQLDVREVKTRGLPELLPRDILHRLRGEGGTAATLVLVRGPGGRRAMLCRRVAHAP